MSGGEGVDGTIPRLLNVMGTITEERSGTSVLSPVEEEREEFITDPQQAIAYFMEYMQAEQRVRERQNRQNALEFFGETFEDSIQHPPVQRRRMSSVGEPVVLKKNKGRKKLAHSNTKVREQVQSLPSFWPIFTVGITGIQIIVVIVLLSIRGLAPINIFPNTDTGYYPSLRNESGNASVSYYRYTNPWIGIGVLDLIQCGAKFTPCMRQDRSIIHRNLVQRATEGDMGGVGCCRNNIWIGSTLPDGCAHTWNPQNDTDYLDRTPCEDTSVLLANFHPCCIGITGQCAVMHVRECNDRGGIFFSNYQSCNETNCLNDICGFNGVGTVDGDPLQPVGGQIWRLVLSLFIHLGVIHVLIVAVIQLVLGIQIERTAGFVRIALIYFISGIGGNLVSAIFIPYQVNGGAAAAVFGLVGVLFVELFQSWQLIDRAWLELVKLTVVMVIMFAIGTLPFIDNLANIGGLLFGIPSAIIFLPYITFGKFDAWRKRILLIICIPILLLMFIVCLFIFIFVSDPNFCFFCHYFNCVPYTSTLCDNEVNSPDPEIVAL
jgi:membrane associated rhomboid family serine protease